MAQPPYRPNHRRTPQITLAAHDGGDGDDVVRVGGVPDAEEKPQKDQRHQIAERFGHNTFTGEFSTPRVDGKARALTATHWQIFILLYQNRGDVVSNDRIRAELSEGSITRART